MSAHKLVFTLQPIAERLQLHHRAVLAFSQKKAPGPHMIGPTSGWARSQLQGSGSSCMPAVLKCFACTGRMLQLSRTIAPAQLRGCEGALPVMPARLSGLCADNIECLRGYLKKVNEGRGDDINDFFREVRP